MDSLKLLELVQDRYESITVKVTSHPGSYRYIHFVATAADGQVVAAYGSDFDEAVDQLGEATIRGLK